MWIWAAFFLWSLGPSIEEPVLHYRIALLPATPGSDEHSGIRIRLRYRANDSTHTTFMVAESVAGAAGGADLVDVAMRWWPPNASSAHVTGKPVREAPNRWTLEHAPRARIECSYSFLLNSNRVSADPSDFVRPLIESHRVHLSGSLALLRPGHLGDWDPLTVAVDWKGFEAAGWTTVSSFGIGDVQFTASPAELGGTVWVAGEKLRLHHREIREQRLVVAIEGDRWPFEDEEFVELARAIVDEQRAFFADDSLPWFLVSLTPVGLPAWNRSTRSGMGLTQSFAVFVKDGMSLGEEGRPGRGIDHLLAHEMFHHWNGLLILREEPVEYAAWFSEGFTDFYARRLLWRAGRVDLETYAKILNATIREHALSPAKTRSNQFLGEHLWEDESTHRMAYLRGDLVASLIDHELRQSSSGERSLDDLMRALATEARSEGSRVSTPGLLARIESLTSPAICERLRAILLDGAPLELPLDLFEPCLSGERGAVFTVDPGFDTHAIRDTGLVSGVRPDSHAFEAGLRDGQRCTSFQFSEGTGEPFVTVRILEDDAERELRFSVRGEEVPVPIYRPKPGAAGSCEGL